MGGENFYPAIPSSDLPATLQIQNSENRYVLLGMGAFRNPGVICSPMQKQRTIAGGCPQTPGWLRRKNEAEGSAPRPHRGRGFGAQPQRGSGGGVLRRRGLGRSPPAAFLRRSRPHVWGGAPTAAAPCPPPPLRLRHLYGEPTVGLVDSM